LFKLAVYTHKTINKKNVHHRNIYAIIIISWFYTFHKYDYIDWSPAFVFIANSEHLFAEIHAAPAVSRDPMQIWWMDAFYGLRDTRMTYTCWGRKEHIQNYDSKLCIRQWLPIKQSLPKNTVLGNLCY